MMRLRLAAVLLFCSLSAGAQPIDLAVTVEGPADPSPGTEREAAIRFHNRDTRAIANIVAFVVHDFAQIVDLAGDGWLCEEAARRSIVACRRNSIQPGEATTLDARIVIPQTTQFGSLRVVHRADQLLALPGAPSYVINYPPATTDLALSSTRREEAEGSRQALILTATVTNRGPAAAENVTLRLLSPDSMPPRSASGLGWTCRVLGRDAICTRPSLPAGATASVDFRHWSPPSFSGGEGVLQVVFTGADATPLDNILPLFLTGTAPPPDPAQFEPVLLPIALLDIPGAFGSLWRTHFTLYNGNDEPLGITDLAYPFENDCFFPVCPSPHGVAARSASSLFIRQRGGTPGVLLWVRKDRIANVDFELRVQDMSRQAMTWGTEIPVVREKDLRTAPFRLLNVPLGERFRQALRIYDVSGSTSPAVLVRFIDAEVGRLLHEQVLPLSVRQPSDDELFGAFRLFPGYAEIGFVASLPELRDSALVHIELAPLSPEQRIWAFVSVTNNETQHVTTISPQ